MLFVTARKPASGLLSCTTFSSGTELTHVGTTVCRLKEILQNFQIPRISNLSFVPQLASHFLLSEKNEESVSLDLENMQGSIEFELYERS